MKSTWRGAAAVLLFTLSAGAVHAEDAIQGRGEVTSVSARQRAGTMLVPLNKSQVLRVDRPFRQALIGNAEIADVMPLSISSVYILGKKTGSTNLTLYDKAHNLVAVVDIVVGPDADSLKRQLFEIMPNEHVGVRVANDSLILDGRVSGAGAVERINAIAETYAPGKVVNLMTTGAAEQVLLEVRFSEMSRTTARSLGIRTLSFSNSGNFNSGTGDNPPSQDFGTTFGTISGSFGIGALNINLALDALEQRGLVTTLAQPNLVALSGETATFLAGGEFPIPVSQNAATSGGAATISIQFKEFGVILGFTPTVLDDGTINLLVAPEVSSIDPSASVRLDAITIPGLKVRRAKTTLELHDGESFAMAGLIQSDFTDTVRQLPLLGNIPIIGNLFRSAGFKRGDTELVITVTPRRVRPTTQDQIKLPTDRVQAPSDLDLFLNGHSADIRGVRPVTPRRDAANGRADAGKPGGIEGDYGHVVR